MLTFVNRCCYLPKLFTIDQLGFPRRSYFPTYTCDPISPNISMIGKCIKTWARPTLVTRVEVGWNEGVLASDCE
jgi:hypothetical protein